MWLGKGFTYLPLFPSTAAPLQLGDSLASLYLQNRATHFCRQFRQILTDLQNSFNSKVKDER